jgi:hypothetical protein
VGRFSYLVAVAISLTSFFGCGVQPRATEKNASDGERYLALMEGVADTSSVDLQAENDFFIRIPKQALRVTSPEGKVTQKETEFLLSASAIPQVGAPTSTAMNGRVIYFELYQDAVDMYESTVGAVVTDDLPARRLLAKFEIVSQDANRVLINFDKGMRSLFIADWTDGGDKFSAGALDSAVESLMSRVHSVKHSPGRLTISQTVQVRTSSLFGGSSTPRYEFRYFLTPYATTAYTGKAVPKSKHVRFFKSYPNLEKDSGRSRANILRFDISQPITFAYSANTPAEFEDAVKEGILYWNQAFGKEVIKAVKAPEGVTAPHPDFNVVQWVPWDSAGFAYADVISDPRTGRSLHGQVYLTSVFGIKGIERARIALRQLQNTLEKAVESPKKKHFHGLGVQFLGENEAWQPAGHCEQNAYEVSASMAKGIAGLLAMENVTDQHILDMSRNYVRETVAHEVGHVLGLRHHFAGNIAANLTAKEQAEWAATALKDGKFDSLPGKFAASSVMEYAEFTAAAYNGQKIKEGKEALPYDKDAIQYAYFDKNDVEDKKTLFCSDEENGGYADCEQFDPTGDPFLGTHTDIARWVKSLPGLFLERYVAAVAPADAADVTKVEAVELAGGFATGAIKPLSDALKRSLNYFKEETKVIGIDLQFPFIGALNEEARMNARWADLQKKIEGVGGTDRLLFSHLPLNLPLDTSASPTGTVPTEKFSTTGFAAKVSELLGTTYAKFIGLDGKEHSFTEAEKKVIEQSAKDFAPFMEKEILKASLSAYGLAPLSVAREAVGVKDEETVLAKVEKQYMNIARSIVMELDPAKTRQGKVRGAMVTVQEFKYPKELRSLATKILASKIGAVPYWSEDFRTSLGTALKMKVDQSLLMADVQNFKEGDLSRTLRDWLAEQKSIMADVASPSALAAPGGGLFLLFQ